MRSLGRLAHCHSPGQARNCDCLASTGLSPFLDMEGATWPNWEACNNQRVTRFDPSDEPREPNMGSSKDSWGVAQTRRRYWRDQRQQVHGSRPEAAFADVARLFGESHKDVWYRRISSQCQRFASGSYT